MTQGNTRTRMSGLHTGDVLRISGGQVEWPLSADFQPTEDITAYELARLIPYMVGTATLTRSAYDALPEGARRHIVLTGER